MANTDWGPGPVNTNWGPEPVNTNWGPGLVNTNWELGLVNTNWVPEPGSRRYKHPFNYNTLFRRNKTFC